MNIKSYTRATNFSGNVVIYNKCNAVLQLFDILAAFDTLLLDQRSNVEKCQWYDSCSPCSMVSVVLEHVHIYLEYYLIKTYLMKVILT